MISRCAAIFAALFLFAVGQPSVAQDVTLTSRDGQVELSGFLLGFDGEFYRVQTDYGELTIDGSGVDCSGPACPSLQNFVAELSFSGSANMGAVLMPALIEGFARREGFKADRIDVDATHYVYHLKSAQTGQKAGVFSFRLTNADEGFADLLADEADIVMSLREIRPAENTRAREVGLGDMTDANRSHVLALDAIVPIVAPGNPVQEIAPFMLARVYAGQITNWRDLGGVDAPIALHAPSVVTGLGQATEDQILVPAALSASANADFHDLSSQVVAEVMRDPFALGVASFAEAQAAQTLSLTGRCGRSLRATRRTIKTEDYPLTAPMFLYTPARRLPQLGREMIGYFKSPEAQVLIRRAGFVDQAPEEVAIDDQGNRFANAIASAGQETTLRDLQRMVQRLDGMKRLTTSFRFDSGAARLDAQSRANVTQLAQRLEQGRYDARTILFAGFSDSDGPADANRKIALERAEAVRKAVVAATKTLDLDRVTMEVDAFGEAMPMACDDSAWGRGVNRRVEVWVR